MRKYKDEKTGKIRKGLALIHIGDDVWRIGKESVTKRMGFSHQIIYGPDDKEYHLYNQEIKWMGAYHEQDSASAKVYILTHILDDKENWCFDLKIKPETGKEIKVIYGNGTVKNITFNGEFEETLISKNWWVDNKIIMKSPFRKRIIPVGYRKK